MGCAGGIKLFGSLIFTFISFAIFCYGGINEILEDQQLHKKLSSVDVDVSADKKWLNVFIILYIVGFSLMLLGIGIFCVLDCCLTWVKHTGQDVKKMQASINLFVRTFQLIFAFSAMNKMLIYGSILNKLRSSGEWNGTDDYSLKSYFVLIPHWGSVGSSSWTIEEQLKVNIVVSGFNIFKSMTLYVPMTIVDHPVAIKKLLIQIALIIPSAAVAGAIGFKIISACMVEHYTQRHYTEQLDFRANHNLVTAIVGALFSGSVTMALLVWVTNGLNSIWISCCGKAIEKEVELKKVEESEPDDQDAEFAAKFMRVGVRYLSGATICMFSIITLALTLVVHNNTGIWNWYFIVDTAYNALLMAVLCLDCCFTMFKFGKMMNGN